MREILSGNVAAHIARVQLPDIDLISPKFHRIGQRAQVISFAGRIKMSQRAMTKSWTRFVMDISAGLVLFGFGFAIGFLSCLIIRPWFRRRLGGW
jgi:hypothetical protein